MAEDLEIDHNIKLRVYHILIMLIDTQYRDIIQAGLRNDFRFRLAVFAQINFAEIQSTHSEVPTLLIYQRLKREMVKLIPELATIEVSDVSGLNQGRDQIVSLGKKRIPFMKSWTE